MMSMESITILTALALGVLGATFGSFAGATVWRIHKRKDIVKDRSECEHCHHKLGPADLIPVLSWLWLKGRCRYCGKSIGQSALWIELGLAVYFVTSYLFWPQPLDSTLAWLDLGLWLAMGIGLAILFLYDLRWFLLPDRVVFALVGLGAIDFGLRAVTQSWSPMQIGTELVLGLAAVAGLYGVLYAVSKGRWVGFGDVKLGVFMGLVLGWKLALLAVFAANVIGTLIVLPGLLTGKLARTSRVPFGPFLIIGFIVAGLWGEAVIEWYMHQLIG